MHKSESVPRRRPGVVVGAATTFALLLAATQVVVLGVSPVGRVVPDLFWVSCLAALVVASSSYAPRIVLVVAALISLGFVSATGLPAGLIAVIGLIVASRTGSWSGHFAQTWQSSAPNGRFLALQDTIVFAMVSGGLFWSTLSFTDYSVPLLSAGIATLMWALITIAATTRLTQPARTRVFVAGTVAVVGFGIIITGAGLQVRSSVNDAREAERALRTSLAEARSGDLSAARDSVTSASASMASVVDRFSSPLVTAFAQLPVAGHNVSAARAPLSPATEILALTETALEQSTDVEGLLGVDGGVDVEQVHALASTSEDLIAEIAGLGRTARSQSSPWILEPLKTQLAVIDAQTKPAEEFSDLELVDPLLELLGSSSPKSYLLLFGNNSEARELGGFTGAFAVMHVADGNVSVTQADRTPVLNREDPSPLLFTHPPPQRFLEHRPWQFPQNYTAIADFPSLGDSLIDLFPAASGIEIDGLLYLDPQALAAVVGLVGEVHLEESDLTVTAENAARLVTVEQYELFDPGSAEREEFLQEVVAEVFDALLGGEIDAGPAQIRALVRAVQQDRLLVLPFDDTALSLAERAGLTGGVPTPTGQDYLAVSHLNGGPNKLDPFLHRNIEYRAEVDPTTGEVDAVVSIELTNDAPAQLPLYANNNRHGYEIGTNRAFVVVHTPHDLLGVSGATEPALTRSFAEFGWQRHEALVAIPQGESRTVEFRLAGAIRAGADYQLDIGHQPLITDDVVTIALSSPGGLPETADPRFGQLGQSLEGSFRLTQDSQVFATLPDPSTPVLARAVGSPSDS